MKVYNLCCERDHRFEGWFASEEDFNSQLSRGQLVCPMCDSRAITKLPSAPRLNLSAGKLAQPDATEQLRARMMKMVREVIAKTEDVGDRFAEEARRIHYKEAPERGIRGTVTTDECTALAEEGIEVVQLAIPGPLKQQLH